MKGFRARHFSLKHIIVSFISGTLFGNYTYTMRHGLAAGMKRKGGLGFVPIAPTETPEIKFLRHLNLKGKVVYDIGAFEGVLTLFFARQAKQVIAWEPNPRNYARCMENIRLNKLENVKLINRGISDQRGTIQLVYDPLMPGAGSGEAVIAEQIGSSVKSAKRLSIPVATLDEEIESLPKPDFIKIDIEGMEFSALKGMRKTLEKYRPELFIEMHGATSKEKIETAHEVIGFLESCRYRSYDVESAAYLTATDNVKPGHLYCTSI